MPLCTFGAAWGPPVAFCNFVFPVLPLLDRHVPWSARIRSSSSHFSHTTLSRIENESDDGDATVVVAKRRNWWVRRSLSESLSRHSRMQAEDHLPVELLYLSCFSYQSSHHAQDHVHENSSVALSYIASPTCKIHSLGHPYIVKKKVTKITIEF